MRFLYTIAVLCDLDDETEAEVLRQRMLDNMYESMKEQVVAALGEEELTDDLRLEINARLLPLGVAVTEIPDRLAIEA